MKNLIAQSAPKAQRLAKDKCSVFFAPLHEMLLLIRGFFRGF
jgi:hypothetical protein